MPNDKKQHTKGQVKESDQSNVYSTEEVALLKKTMKEEKRQL